MPCSSPPRPGLPASSRRQSGRRGSRTPRWTWTHSPTRASTRTAAPTPAATTASWTSRCACCGGEADQLLAAYCHSAPARSLSAASQQPVIAAASMRLPGCKCASLHASLSACVDACQDLTGFDHLGEPGSHELQHRANGSSSSVGAGAHQQHTRSSSSPRFANGSGSGAKARLGAAAAEERAGSPKAAAGALWHCMLRVCIPTLRCCISKAWG